MTKKRTQIEKIYQLNNLLFLLDKQLKNNELNLLDVAENLSGMIHINDPIDNSLKYINTSGAYDLGREKEELYKLGYKFTKVHIHPLSMRKNIPQFNYLYQQNDTDQCLLYLQHYKSTPKDEYQLLISAKKILKKDKSLLTMSATPKQLGILTQKLEKIIKEEYFVEKHLQQFQLLTKREKEILTLLALGNTSSIIGDTLCISTHTVGTHRKNIYRKLGIKNIRDVINYATSFDLI